MIGVAISIWQAIVGGSTSAALGDDSGGASTAGQPIGLLLILTKAS